MTINCAIKSTSIADGADGIVIVMVYEEKNIRVIKYSCEDNADI